MLGSMFYSTVFWFIIFSFVRWDLPNHWGVDVRAGYVMLSILFSLFVLFCRFPAGAHAVTWW